MDPQDSNSNQFPFAHQRNGSNRFSTQQDTGISPSNSFTPGDSNLSKNSAQGYSYQGNVNQYGSGYEKGSNKPDPFQNFLYSQQNTQPANEKSAGYAPPYYQNLPNMAFPVQRGAQGQGFHDMPQNMMPGMPGPELFMGNMHLMQQFNQFLQFMNSQQQGKGFPSFMNPGFGLDPQQNQNLASSQLKTNRESANPLTNSTSSKPEQSYTQSNWLDEDALLPSESKLVEGNYSSNQRRMFPDDIRGEPNDFDSYMPSHSPEKQQETERGRETQASSVSNNVKGKWKERPNKVTDEDSNNEDTARIEKQNTAVNPFDEIKVGGAGANKKFEDLLEEQLKKNPEAIMKGSIGASKPATKKEFLKRGVKGGGTREKSMGKSSWNEEKENLGEDNSENNTYGNNAYMNKGGYAKTFNSGGNALNVRHMNEISDNQENYSNRFNPSYEEKYTSNNDKRTTAKSTNYGSETRGKENYNTYSSSELFSQNKPQKEQKGGYTPQGSKNVKGRGAQREYEDSLEEEENNSEDENRNIQFDDDLEDWRSPGRGAYNVNKYARQEASGDKEEEQEEEEEQQEEGYGEEQQGSERSGSPGYKFDDEEEDMEEHYGGKGNVRKHTVEIKKSEEENKPKGKKFFWEMGNEDARENEYEREAKKEKAQEKKTKIDPYMDERLQALEKEIAKFKAENERVKNERKKLEGDLKDLEKEASKWDDEKEQQKREMEEWRQEETKKIKKEKKSVAESHQNLYKNVSVRKEREEIEQLKKQLEELKEEVSLKDKKAKTNLDKLKKRLDEENQQTLELKQELKYFEEIRIKGNLNKGGKAVDSGYNRGNTQQQQQQPQGRGSEQEVKKGTGPKYNYYKRTVEEEEHSEEEEEDVIHEEADEEDSREYQRDRYNKSGRHNEDELRYEDIMKEAPRRPSINKVYTKEPKEQIKPVETKHKPPKIEEIREKERAVQGKSGGEQTAKGRGQDLQNSTAEYAQRAYVGEAPVLTERKVFNDDDYFFDSNSYYQKYMAGRNKGGRILKEVTFDEGKVQIQRVYEDGRREDVFFNGVRRQTFPDGYNVVFFVNGDIRQTLPDSTIVYFYAEAETTQTKPPNGLCIYRFNKDNNNQLEFHYPDESKDIYFPDGTRKIVYPNQEEETRFNDGTIQRINSQNVKVINYANGTKETKYPDGLRILAFPDGRVQKFFPDGTTERY